MKNPNLLAEIVRPSRGELAAARRAMRAARAALGPGSGACGCFAQVSVNPFYSGIVAHWRTYHAESVAMLVDAQATVLEAVASEMAASRGGPVRLHVVPQPVRIG